MGEKKKRRWGDRRDGRWVRETPGLQSVMPVFLNRLSITFFLLKIKSVRNTKLRTPENA